MKYVYSIIAAIALTTALMATDAGAEDRYGKQKVVYHINYDGGPDDKKYRGAMRNI